MHRPLFPQISGELGSLVFHGRKTSEATCVYNCVAWAFRKHDRFWWPDPWSPVWPVPLVGSYALGEFENLFAKWGWSRCASDAYEPGQDKIALYVDTEQTPTHLARMVTDDEYGPGTSGLWTSKLGRDIDALHELEALCGNDRYGTVFALYSKHRI